MSIQIITKSSSVRGKVENFSSDLKEISYRKTSVQHFNKDLYKLEFIFNYANYPIHSIKRIRENWEYICWLNSPVSKQAESVGWTTNKEKLPTYDNDDLYLPHSLYHDPKHNQTLSLHCPHIRPLNPESTDFTKPGNKSIGGRHAA